MAEVDEEEVDLEHELTEPEIVTKYKTAAGIVNAVMEFLIKEAVPGKKIIELCVLGDRMMNDKLSQVYVKPKVEKGVAFPTSVSVNHCVGHFSPLLSDNVATTLQEGDIAKIDLGVQIDGYISVAAHTVAVTSQANQPIGGRKADVICAAYYAAEAAHRLIRPGNKNTQVTEVINKIAQVFKCNMVEGVLSHQMKRFVIDGNQSIIGKSTVEHKVEEFEFEENQVYCCDIVVSSGEGKPKELDTKTTIFKRAVDQNYLLKMKASREVFNQVNSKFPTFPFNLRALGDEKRAKLGITEMLKHNLVNPYPVLYEKQGEYVAQFKFTLLLLPSGTSRENTFPPPYVASDYKIEDSELNAILAMSTKREKKS